MNFNIQRRFTLPAVVIGAIVASAQAKAQAPLPPGGTVSPVPGYTATAGGGFAILADTGAVPWSIGGFDTGTVRELVVTGDISNPRGGLDYVYQISVTKGTVARLSGASFASFLTDVGQNANAGAGPPFLAGTQGADNATRSLDGSTVNFNFVPALTVSPSGAPGVSYVLFILTNSQAFNHEGIIAISDSAQTTIGLAGYAPAVAGVPEPGSLIIMASCFLGLVGAYAYGRTGFRFPAKQISRFSLLWPGRH